MNELQKTGLFVAAAAVSLGLAWSFRPGVIRSEGEIAAEKRGAAIFPDLDPDTATSFRLTRFNESMATLSRIELSKDAKSGLWSLPSADGYPADSAEQVSRAITPLVELKVLSTVSTDRGDHALYGVVEPNEQDLTVSASGVGTMVQVGGSDNQILASLIVGKKVDGSDNQHFVRVPTEDAVYEVEISTDGFTTDLEKWIKGDILNVRSFDIEYVGLRDYAIVRTERGYGLGRNFDADLEHKDNKWSLASFVDHTQEGSPVSLVPPEGKQLQEQPLNDLRNNIQNLKIVNVRRKPAGLAADLKADNSLMQNEESIRNLQSQGFFPMDSGDVYAAGGELIVGTKDGVRYLLRFGNTRVTSSMMESDEDSEESSGSGVNRYVLVTAQLDESKFPAPELKAVPETVEEMLAQEADDPGLATENFLNDDALDEQNNEVSDSEVANATEPQADSDANSADSPESSDQPKVDATDENQTPSEVESSTETPDASPVEDAAAQPDASASLGQDQDADKFQRIAGHRLVSFSASSAQEGDSDEDTDTQLVPSSQETAEELQERLEFLQETLRKENQRLIDSRNEKLNEARKKVAELNARFADWYYIVSDSVYDKLKISRDNLFQAAGAEAGSPSPSNAFQLPNLPAGIELPTE